MEPWGFCGSNLNAALIASTVANFSGRVEKPLSINKFRLDVTTKEEPEDELSIDEIADHYAKVLS